MGTRGTWLPRVWRTSCIFYVKGKIQQTTVCLECSMMDNFGESSLTPSIINTFLYKFRWCICPLRFPKKNDVRFVLTSSCMYEGSCLIYVIYVCSHITVCFLLLFSSCVLYTLCCPFRQIVICSLALRCSLAFTLLAPPLIYSSVWTKPGR